MKCDDGIVDKEDHIISDKISNNLKESLPTVEDIEKRINQDIVVSNRYYGETVQQFFRHRKGAGVIVQRAIAQLEFG